MPHSRTPMLASAMAAAALVTVGCGGGAPAVPSLTDARLQPIAHTNETAVLVGAGDIAICESRNAERTASILDGIGGTVFTAGDNSNEQGSTQNFAECYEPTWGRHKSRTMPSPGDHDYLTAGAEPYFQYFGANAGSGRLGYYSYILGNWQIFSLNSNVPASPGSAQYEWLKRELSATAADCRLAYWHLPVFNSGFDRNRPEMRDMWRLLYQYGADVVISGHAHDYERLAPMNPDGGVDTARGIRQFVVGTGGATFTSLVQRHPNSEVFAEQVLGVLKLTLEPNAYRWEFVPYPGYKFSDSGSGVCSQ